MSDPGRKELEEGLRFLHVMGMQTKLDVHEALTQIFSLVEELIGRGLVDLRSLDERRERVKKQEGERRQKQAHVQVGATVDKYALKDLPQIDCPSLLHLCKARCCRLTFPLSFQDLDEGVVRWDYGLPYHIRQGEDGYCVHCEGEHRGCNVYEKRPAVCREYDCRTDKRVWIDFEKKIPAPDDSIPGRMRLPVVG